MLPQGAPTKALALPLARAQVGTSASTSAVGSAFGAAPGSAQTDQQAAVIDALSPLSNASSTSRGAPSIDESPGTASLYSGLNGSVSSRAQQTALDNSDISSKNSSATRDPFSPGSLNYQASISSGSADVRFDSPLFGADAFSDLAAFTGHDSVQTPLPERLPVSAAISISRPLSGLSSTSFSGGPLSTPLSGHIPENSLDQPLNQALNVMDSIDQPDAAANRLEALEGEFAAAESPMLVDPTNEYFMNLGVFPDQMGDAVGSHKTAAPQSRFRFHNSASAMVFQAIDPVLHDQLGAISRLLLPPRRASTRNVVNQRILSYRQVVRLFGFFKSNYNHWISLPDAEPEDLANFLLEQCPLLVTTCCCIALRFGSSELWQTTYPSLVRYLTYELAQTLVSLPQTIECLQALTILAKYADAISYGDFVFDMWYISGVGIQHLQTVASISNQFSYIHMRLWNHLVLAHLSSANISGRAVLVGECDMQMCRLVLDEGLATRFDSCMVAELMVQWLTIQFLRQHISYFDFEKGVAEWQQEWGMLAQLPMIQFIEPVLLFCCFLVRWTYHYRFLADSNSPPLSPQGDEFSYGAAVNMSTETLYDELQNICVILNALLNMVHAEYFGCLSDSLHGTGFISAIMAMVITKVLVDRGEATQTEQKQQLSACAQLISQLIHRFQVTSRGQDIFRTRCVALTQLLKSNPFF